MGRLHTQLTSWEAFEGLILKFDLVSKKCNAHHVTAVPEASAGLLSMSDNSHYV